MKSDVGNHGNSAAPGIRGQVWFLVAAIVAMLVLGIVHRSVLQGELAVGQRDAVEYLSVAESLVDGRGLQVPFGEPGLPIDFEEARGRLTFFPPGVPVVLAAVMTVLGVTAMEAAVVLQSVAWALALVVAVGVVWTATRSPWRASIAGLVVGSALFPLSLSPMSEPSYVVVMLLFIAVSATFLRTGDRRWFWFAILMAAIGLSLRYSGIALAVALMLIAAVANTKWADRVRDSLLALVLGGVVPLVGLNLADGEWSSRSVVWHPPTLADLKVASAALARFMVWAWEPQVAMAGVALVTVGVVGVTTYRLARQFGLGSVEIAGFAVASSHFVVLLLTVALLDAQTALNYRQLLPIFVPSAVAVAAAPGLYSRSQRILVGFIAVMIVATGVVGGVRLLENRQDKLRFAGQAWRTSQTMEAVEQLSPDTRVFSNASDAIYLLTGRSVWSLPIEQDPWTLRSGRSEEILRVVELVASGDAVIVVFDDIDRPYLVSTRVLIDHGLSITAQYDDGVIVAGE